MAYQRWWKTIRDQQGNAINGANCAVYNGGTGTLATIYDPNTDDSAPGGLPNPFTTTANGVFGFMAADGKYDVQISGGALATQQFRLYLNADWTDANAALKAYLETNGYILDQSGVASMAIVPTGFAQSMGIQSTVNDSASRLYIVPKGSPTGATGTLKIFATDYIADPTNYRDLGIYYETTNAEFRINSKYNGTPGSPAPVYFTTMDGAYIAGGFYQGANYAGMVLGGRIPAGVTYYASVPTIFTASAVFLNNTLLRWYRADGVGVGHGVRFNASNQYEVLNDGSVVLRCTSAYTEVTGALLTDLLVGTAGQATPSVAGTSFLQVPTNGAGYNITDFIGASQGQRLTVLFGDNKPTLVNSSGLRLAGGVNFTGSAGSTISFIRGSSGWFETSRSVN